MIEEIAVALADVGIGEGLVYFERAGGHPFAVLIVAAVLSDLADVDFGVEIGGESLAVVTSVAVHDVEILHVGEIMLGCIGCEYTRYSRVKTAAEDGGEAGFLETLLVGPLP